MQELRPLALCAALTLGFGSLVLAGPANAEAPQTRPAQQTDSSQDEVQQEVLDAISGFAASTGTEPMAGGVSSGEGVVILVDKAEKTDEVIKYADAVADGQVEGVRQVAFAEKAQAFAATDVVGGAGYIAEDGGMIYSCSVGFSAWSSSGAPALISAGHCTHDGALTTTALSKPSTEPAVGGPGYESNGTGVLGEFAFSQHGGPGNSNGAENDPSSTDISVINVTNPGVSIYPAVTDWSGAPSDNLAASTLPVRSVANPVSGAVAMSGRTTGFRQGKTLTTLQDVQGNPTQVEVLDGYWKIDGRWVHGFLSNAESNPGDSGGAVIQGDKAVGIVSGGPASGEYTWSTRLKDALPYTGGYEIALDIAKPAVTAPANNGHVQPGTAITGTAPANAASVTYTVNGGAAQTAPVSGGTFSVAAPTDRGNYSYTFAATNGHSRSQTVSHALVVDMAMPTIAAVDTDKSQITLSGTGIPTAEVTVTVDGEVVGTATVGAGGDWTLDVELEIGEHAVSATQEFQGETSPAGTSVATVRPVSPAITSLTDGDSFAAEKAPSAISGTGIDGATVNVSVTGITRAATTYTAVVTNGKWTVELGGALQAANYAVSATQTVNAVASREAAVRFVVLGADYLPAPLPNGGATDPNALATTGSQLPLGVATIAMLLVAGGAAALVARRRAANRA
ncbi:trypsin-like serine protease [Leucobacter insecticola]|uniref:Trypsin-like serine protease n=1 Tax=Leucobacter insecticola TaxID=2714934 RepID=A0A6G8FGN7_9MICO|nr:trypsin-like serine protease [Leucobacter insecticola]QIM15514.1 trypsin-like serine protease [Leucobacter insecticola]